MGILEELNRVIEGTVDGRLIKKGHEVVAASFQRGLLVLFIDDRLEILSLIIPILNTTSAVKKLKMITILPDPGKYDKTIISRLIYESKIERLLRVRTGPPPVYPSREFLRSVVVPEWCAQYIMLLQEKLPLELIRLVIKTLFYSAIIR